MTDGPQVPRAEKAAEVGTETLDQLCDLGQPHPLALSALIVRGDWISLRGLWTCQVAKQGGNYMDMWFICVGPQFPQL